MDQQDYWKQFLRSGDPMAYLGYRSAGKEAALDVHQDPGTGAPGDGIQGCR